MLCTCSTVCCVHVILYVVYVWYVVLPVWPPPPPGAGSQLWAATRLSGESSRQWCCVGAEPAQGEQAGHRLQDSLTGSAQGLSRTGPYYALCYYTCTCTWTIMCIDTYWGRCSTCPALRTEYMLDVNCTVYMPNSGLTVRLHISSGQWDHSEVPEWNSELEIQGWYIVVLDCLVYLYVLYIRPVSQLKLRNVVTTQQEKLLGEKEAALDKLSQETQALRSAVTQRDEEVGRPCVTRYMYLSVTSRYMYL